MLYSQETKVEFTPFSESENIVGHAIALNQTTTGIRPEITVTMRVYFDSPRLQVGYQRQGITLAGTDQFDQAVT